MADRVTPAQRSRIMSRIRGKNTKIELTVRSQLHRRGFRFRLHRRDLPGKPDIVLPKHHAVIFVNGCFWHGHGCQLSKLPKTNEAFWRDKIDATRERDRRASRELAERGWRVLTVWECAIRGTGSITDGAMGKAVESWIRSNSQSAEIKGEGTGTLPE